MKIVTEKLPNGNTITYQELESGTCYRKETPRPIIERLEDARIRRYRVRIFTETQRPARTGTRKTT